MFLHSRRYLALISLLTLSAAVPFVPIFPAPTTGPIIGLSDLRSPVSSTSSSPITILPSTTGTNSVDQPQLVDDAAERQPLEIWFDLDKRVQPFPACGWAGACVVTRVHSTSTTSRTVTSSTNEPGSTKSFRFGGDILPSLGPILFTETDFPPVTQQSPVAHRKTSPSTTYNIAHTTHGPKPPAVYPHVHGPPAPVFATGPFGVFSPSRATPDSPRQTLSLPSSEWIAFSDRWRPTQTADHGPFDPSPTPGWLQSKDKPHTSTVQASIFAA